MYIFLKKTTLLKKKSSEKINSFLKVTQLTEFLLILLHILM